MHKTICYLIGAGLTKSLELRREFRVPLMFDFVSVLADHIADDTVLTALTNFESGGIFDWSRPEWIAMASALDVSSQISEREKYAQVLRTRPSENIEQLLLNAAKKRGNFHAEMADLRFGFAINTVFARIGWNLKLDLLIGFLRRQFAMAETEHVFISYNYDLVLDRCIQLAASDRWSPTTGYGIRFREGIRCDEAADHMRQFRPFGGGAYSLLDPHPLTSTTSDFLLYKPHGSLNWRAPFKGNYVFTGDDPLLMVDDAGHVAYCDAFAVEQVADTGRPEAIAFDTGVYITPPTETDSVTSKAQVPLFLEAVRNGARNAVRLADELIVIGWSMPATDKAEVAQLQAAMASGNPARRVTAVNYNADVAYFRRLAAVCHVDESVVTVFNGGFVDFAMRP